MLVIKEPTVRTMNARRAQHKNGRSYRFMLIYANLWKHDDSRPEAIARCDHRVLFFPRKKRLSATDVEFSKRLAAIRSTRE